MIYSKSIRKKDENLLEFYRKRRCDICNRVPCDPAHIKTRGSGGPDEHWNLMSLCRVHHTEQGQLGFFKMCQKYPFFHQFLAGKGWVFDGNKKLRR
jgi:hypothetical protein